MSAPRIIDQLNLWQRLTWFAHLWKACTKQHHQELIPHFARYITPGDVVLDIGAHAGQFSKLFAGLASKGQVYSFEPSSYALSILNKAIRFTGKNNVTIVPTGLGSAAGTFILSIPLKSSGSVGYGVSFVGDPSQEERHTVSESVTITTLDTFVHAQQIDRVDFIKADIEGFELKMLRGAREVLECHQPAIYMEIYEPHLKRAGTSPAEVFQFIEEAGYVRADLASGTALAKEILTEGDHLFLAKNKKY